MKLYLVRHGIAEPHNVTPDEKRALTPEGRLKIRQAAEGLRRLGIKFDLILTSPLTRARQTAEIVAAELGQTKITEMRELVGDVDPKITVEALKPYQKIESLALVGHNPHLEGLLALLIAGSDRGANISLKKGGVARLDAELSDTRIKAALTWLATPKLLRGS